MADLRLSSVGPTGDAGDRVADLAEEVEVAEGVAGLPLGNRAEQGGDVRVALDVRLLGEVEVAAVGLALAGERLLQVRLGLAVLECWHGGPFWWLMRSYGLLVGMVGDGGRRRWRRRRGAGGPAVGAQAPEDDLGRAHLETEIGALGDRQVGEVDDQVADAAAAPAHQMVVGVVDVGVEAGHAGPDVEGGDLPQFGQVVERLVDGLEGDGLHLPQGGGVDRLGRRMGLVTLEDPEDALPLSGHLAAGRPEQLGQLFGSAHGRQRITTDCQSTIIVEIIADRVGPPEGAAAHVWQAFPMPAPAPGRRAVRTRPGTGPSGLGVLRRPGHRRRHHRGRRGARRRQPGAEDRPGRTDDFASGTSSKSSKLIHGGLRYLQQHEYRLVYENLAERQRLLDNAPHLVTPLPFLIPLFGKPGVVNKGVARVYRTALWLYDLTGGVRIGRRHEKVTREQALAHMPTLRADRLAAGFLYWDARSDDSRLTLTVLRTAVLDHGATAANHTPVTGLVTDATGRVGGATVAPVGGEPFDIRASVVVNAAGVWSDEVRTLDEHHDPHSIRPAKGIHITVPEEAFPCDIAAVIPVSEDKRSIFVVSWGDQVYLGTTDTAWDGPLDDPSCTPEDVDYILGAANAVSTRQLTRADITGIWSGLRPLLAPEQKGASSERTADLSRRHTVRTSEAGWSP